MNFGGTATNVLEEVADKWDPVDMQICKIRQFRIQGRVLETSELESFQNGNALFKFMIADAEGDQNKILCKVWGTQAQQFAGLIKKGGIYRIEAVHVNQTRKQVRAGLSTFHLAITCG